MSLLNLISFIKSGSNRKKVLGEIPKNKFTPSELTQIVFNNKNHTNFVIISRVLKEFSDKNIVVCLNPKEKTGRIFELTKIGKNILKEL